MISEKLKQLNLNLRKDKLIVRLSMDMNGEITDKSIASV